ncbi:hypothetical protein [Muricoccus roseus]|nr:hypothetical protein [Roseomonas rosea]
MPDPILEPVRHELRQTATAGAHDGPSWTYRGATIHSNQKGTLFALDGGPADLPGSWLGVGTKELLVRVVDAWLDHRRLPQGYRVPE